MIAPGRTTKKSMRGSFVSDRSNRRSAVLLEIQAMVVYRVGRRGFGNSSGAGVATSRVVRSTIGLG